MWCCVMNNIMDRFEEIAMQLRKWKLKLGKELNKIQRKAIADEIMQIAETICPTKYSFGGGQLLISWFM